MAGALRNHQQNWNRMQDNTYSGIEQRADEAAMQNQTELRSKNLAMDMANMDDATTRREHNLGLVGDLGKLSPGLIAMGNTGMATAGARQGEWDTPQFKTGGLIDGPPPPPDGSDNVDIKAKAGEYVLPPEAVQLLGLETLDRIVTVATGQPPVHGGTPTDEGKPGFATGGGVLQSLQQGLEDRRTQVAKNIEAKRAAGWQPSVGGFADFAGDKLAPEDSYRRAVVDRAKEVGGDIFGAPSVGAGVGQAARHIKEGLGAGLDMMRPVVPDPVGFAKDVQSGFKNEPPPSQSAPQAASTPSKAPSAPLGAHLPAHPDDDPKAMAYFTAPGDNVQATGITGKDSAGNVQQVYKNEFAPGSADYNEYGRAIYSDSKRGATKRGFDADFAKTGNYVGDPKTGQGMSLPPTVGQGGRMGLGELSPKETQAVLMGYGPARQAGLQAMRDNANLEVMRQWKGQDLTNAPPEVKDLFGKPQGLDTLVERYMADTLSPEGQARRRQHETQLATLKAAESRRNQADPSTKIPGQMLDHFLKLNKDTDQGRANMALNTVMDYLPTMQQLGMSDAQMATVSTDLLNAIDGVTLSKAEAKGLTDQQQAQALALKQRTEYERQLRARLGLPVQ